MATTPNQPGIVDEAAYEAQVAEAEALMQSGDSESSERGRQLLQLLLAATIGSIALAAPEAQADEGADEVRKPKILIVGSPDATKLTALKPAKVEVVAPGARVAPPKAVVVEEGNDEPPTLEELEAEKAELFAWVKANRGKSAEPEFKQKLARIMELQSAIGKMKVAAAETELAQEQLETKALRDQIAQLEAEIVELEKDGEANKVRIEEKRQKLKDLEEEADRLTRSLASND